jgi:uncharacterized protein (DUF2235 family)
MRIYYNRKLSEKPRDQSGNPTGLSVTGKFKETFGRRVPVHFLGLWDTVTSVGWIYSPVVLQATTNNPGVLNVRHAISIDERRAFFRQNMWGKIKPKEGERIQDVKQVWFAGSHSDVGGSYAADKSGLSNIALEWMLAEAMGKGLLIGDMQNAKAIVSENADPHLQPMNESLAGFWYVAEIWMKMIRKKKGKDMFGKDIWVSRPYFNLGRFRVIPTDEKQTLHESVLLRLQQMGTYRPKNVMKICPEIKDIQEKFLVEKWVHL